MPLRFADFALDVDTRQLLRDGVDLRLTPKAFELLAILVGSRPRALSKADLIDRLWPDTYVSDNSLVSLIAEIREALRDDARQPRFIRTVPRFGYAFAGDIAEQTPERVVRSGGLGCWVMWEGRQIPLTEQENIIGREPDATVWIDSTTVSRRHARIVVAGTAATVEDLGSKNGTYVSGRHVTTPTSIVDGDEIRVGSIVLKFRMPSAAGSTASATSPTHDG